MVEKSKKEGDFMNIDKKEEMMELIEDGLFIGLGIIFAKSLYQWFHLVYLIH